MQAKWIVTAVAACLVGTGTAWPQDPVGSSNRNPGDPGGRAAERVVVPQGKPVAKRPVDRAINVNPYDLRRSAALIPDGAVPRAEGVGGFDILVYDQSTQHNLAQTAAKNISPLGTVVANQSTFNTLLASQAWDLVAVDCPSLVPAGGWGQLIAHVRAGGHVVMSFWDWDNSTPGVGDPGLPPAFEVAVARTISLTGQTLFDSGALPVFAGVTMPNADWHTHFGDDGDEFDPQGAAVGLAHIGSPGSTPVIVRGSHTIAACVLDEAGDTWLRDGSGVRLWENMMLELLRQLDVLVYDHDTQHSLARQAAANLSPFGVMVAGQSTFNSQLASRRWDVVVVDCPNLSPTGGWGPFIGYVRSGGKTVMSFWDWDNDSGFGDPALPAAFDVLVVPPPPSFSLLGQTLQDSGSSPVFHDVTMPNMDWHNHWGDDGDQFRLLGGTTGLAHVGNPQTPVIVRSRNRQAIAALVIDEAGDTWLGDNSGVRLWENLIKDVLSETDILVYDNNTQHSLAQAAALGIDPYGTVVADAATFNGLVTLPGWDLVAVDCPSSPPSTGWTDLISFVNAGGRAILAFWDWNNAAAGDPLLPGTFDVALGAGIMLPGQTLFDSGATALFAGVTMPNADWHDHWFDDGDEFVPLGGAVGIGHLGMPTRPVMVRGNDGRTIAAFALDEAGDTWLGDGSGVQLWSNMMHELLGGCPSLKAVESVRLGAPPNPPALLPGVTNGPILGVVWDPRIDHSAFLPTAVGDVLALGVFRVNVPSPYGTLLCDLAGPVIFLSGPPGARFPIPIPPNCALIGGNLCLQGISSDGFVIRLTNALDVTIGTF